jgi:pilus assembly protein CpaE
VFPVRFPDGANEDGSVDDVTRVVLGLEEPSVTEEVMHFLDRGGRARVVATASDERQLAEAVRQLEPDAIVASPRLARLAGSISSGALFALDTAESVRALRGAIRAGARGFYVWPAEREELAGATARALPSTTAVAGKRGLVLAVYGPRGGSGATFLATHLAAALARRDRSCVLVDLDLAFADVTHAVGATSDEPLRTIADIIPLVDELSARHLDEILWEHAAGFRVLLAPGDQAAAARIDADAIRSTIDAVAARADVVVLHIPRGMDDVTRAGLGSAARVALVLQLDVLSFRAAKRAVSSMRLDGRCEFVVNAARRGEIIPADVERAFGKPPVAVIPVDRDARRAQDHGRLLSLRGRTGRAIDRLAGRLLEAPE